MNPADEGNIEVVAPSGLDANGIGSSLRASDPVGDPDGDPDPESVEYQWERLVDGGDWEVLTAASGTGSAFQSYSLTPEDVGYSFRVVYRYTDGDGTPEVVTSPETAVFTELPVVSNTIDLSGFAFVDGDTTSSGVDGVAGVDYLSLIHI